MASMIDLDGHTGNVVTGIEISSMAKYRRAAHCLKALAHPQRLQILDILRRQSQCVCCLQDLLQRSQPYVSQQLRILRQAGIICGEKQDTRVFYTLIDLQVYRLLWLVLGPVGHSSGPSPGKDKIATSHCVE